MAAFEYKALDAKGKHKKGTIEGDNARQVRQRLKEQGMIRLKWSRRKLKRLSLQVQSALSAASRHLSWHSSHGNCLR